MRSKTGPDGRGGTFIEAARRAQVVEAAIETLNEVGYGRASLARIAQQAGISKSVITYHFAGKDDLFDAVVSHVLVDCADFMQPRLAAADTAAAWLQARIRAELAYMWAHHANFVALGEIYVKATYPRIEVNGMGIAAKENQGSRRGVPEPAVRMSAYPGGYRATIPENPLLEPKPQFVGTVANDEYSSVEIPLTLKESGKAEVRRQVKQRIDNCVQSTDLVPKDGELYCPFRSRGSVEGPDANQRDIEWSVKKYPKVRIFHEPTFLASGVQVRANEWGEEAGVVSLSYTADDPFETKPKKVTTEVMFGVDATAEVVQGKVRFVDG